MKTFLIISTLLLFAFTSTAQLTKKTWLVGGTGSFSSYNQSLSYSSTNITAKYTSIDISTSVGYFVIDKLVLGLSPSFSYYKGNVTSQGLNYSPTKYSIGPFARYYLLNSEKPFNLLADIRYQFGIAKNPSPSSDKGKLNNFSIMAGPEIFFNSSVGLEILLGYKTTTETIDNSPNAYTDKRKGFQVSVGFQIHLQKL